MNNLYSKIIIVTAIIITLGLNVNLRNVMASNINSDFIKGADISMLSELEKDGATFYYDGVQQDPLEILQQNGVNYVRLRIWNDPFDSQGNPYGGGTNDLDTTIELAKRAKKLDLKVLLAFHYSDFWVDPGKQNIPKEWQDYSFEEMNIALYEYTRYVMTEMYRHDVFPDMVQIGNEINGGILWPHGQSYGQDGNEFDRLSTFLNSGIQAVSDVSNTYADAQMPQIMLHLANGGDHEVFRWWFDEIVRRDVEFDIIGISYYPYWDGTIGDLKYNMDRIAQAYGKEIIVVETAYGFTLENGGGISNIFGGDQEIAGGYPATVQGQYDFLRDLMNAIKNVPNQQGIGMFYWEPLWIPSQNVGWTTQAGLDYLGDRGEIGNAWDNQAMFDFNGNALDSLGVFRN